MKVPKGVNPVIFHYQRLLQNEPQLHEMHEVDKKMHRTKVRDQEFLISFRLLATWRILLIGCEKLKATERKSSDE